MAQSTKFVIDANLSGIQLRTQASEMLTALSTLNSGDLEPVNPSASMLWLDTTKNILKIRDKTNTAWLDFAGVNDKVIAASAADSTKLGGLAADKYAKKDDIPAAPQAATETAGIVKLKNSITGNLADTAISENAAKQYADAISNRLLGIDQTLQNVTSQRQIGVTYTNKTGRPIYLTIMCLAWANYTIKIGDVSIPFGGGDQGRTSKQTYYGIVPNDVEYSLTEGSSFYWWELR